MSQAMPWENHQQFQRYGSRFQQHLEQSHLPAKKARLAPNDLAACLAAAATPMIKEQQQQQQPQQNSHAFAGAQQGQLDGALHAVADEASLQQLVEMLQQVQKRQQQQQQQQQEASKPLQQLAALLFNKAGPTAQGTPAAYGADTAPTAAAAAAAATAGAAQDSAAAGLASSAPTATQQQVVTEHSQLERATSAEQLQGGSTATTRRVVKVSKPLKRRASAPLLYFPAVKSPKPQAATVAVTAAAGRQGSVAAQTSAKQLQANPQLKRTHSSLMSSAPQQQSPLRQHEGPAEGSSMPAWWQAAVAGPNFWKAAPVHQWATDALLQPPTQLLCGGGISEVFKAALKDIIAAHKQAHAAMQCAVKLGLLPAGIESPASSTAAANRQVQAELGNAAAMSPSSPSGSLTSPGYDLPGSPGQAVARQGSSSEMPAATAEHGAFAALVAAAAQAQAMSASHGSAGAEGAAAAAADCSPQPAAVLVDQLASAYWQLSSCTHGLTAVLTSCAKGASVMDQPPQQSLRGALPAGASEATGAGSATAAQGLGSLSTGGIQGNVGPAIVAGLLQQRAELQQQLSIQQRQHRQQQLHTAGALSSVAQQLLTLTEGGLTDLQKMQLLRAGTELFVLTQEHQQPKQQVEVGPASPATLRAGA